MPEIKCPMCGKSETVEKVSTIYLTGLGLQKEKRADGNRLSGRVKPSADIRNLSGKMAPPSSQKKAFTRPVHPDQALLAFTVVTPIFLWGIFTSQANLLVPVLVLLVVFYGAYFWQRRRLLEKFQSEQAIRRDADGRVKRGIERWMRLYYCREDDVVFEPGKVKTLPLDQLPGYLSEE